MSDKIKLRSYAKLNLYLEITGKRQDGYHLLKSVMQSVSLYDTLEFSLSDGDEIEIETDVIGIPLDEKNLIWKAIEAFYRHADWLERKKVKVQLDKQIPSMAGMAGGSSNAAAALIAMNELYHRPFSDFELCGIGAKVGADVPFCIVGGTVLCEGIGDKLTSLPALTDCYFVVVKPDVSISTPQAYKRFDEMTIADKPNFDCFSAGLESGDLQDVAASMYNSLECACDMQEIAVIKQKLIKNGAINAMMTGSGSAVFGVFDDEQAAKSALDSFKDYPFSDVVKPVDKGVDTVD